MTKSIGLICGDSDNEELLNFAESIGLIPLPMALDLKFYRCPKAGRFCYLSVVPEHELHPYGSPPSKIADVIDPMLTFIRPYHDGDFLVFGQLRLNDDNQKLAAIVKPYFFQLSKWIRRNWSKYGNSYIGPEARELVNLGVAVVNVAPTTLSERSNCYARFGFTM
jgi:hypothetical protein